MASVSTEMLEPGSGIASTWVRVGHSSRLSPARYSLTGLQATQKSGHNRPGRESLDL